MVHFNDQDKQEEDLNLADRILQITKVNDRVSYMDKLEGLNKEFQTKVIYEMCDKFVIFIKDSRYVVYDSQYERGTNGLCSI